MKKFLEINLRNKMSYYIVYSYKPTTYTIPTKFIEGIYENLEQATKRQLEICGSNSSQGLVNGSLYGNNIVSFINVIPTGSCHIELFTTSSN